MSDINAFLAAIIDNPADAAPRLVFADWLEEHDDQRFATVRLGTAGDAVALFAPIVLADGCQLMPVWTGRQDVGPWWWTGTAEARQGWLPAVVIKSPLAPTRIRARVTDVTSQVWLRTPDAALVCWSAKSRDWVESPIPTLQGDWFWLLTRGSGETHLNLTIEDRRGGRFAVQHFPARQCLNAPPVGGSR